MKLYRLPVKILEPTQDQGGKYVAEVPLLPGCRAWGDSAAEALENVHSVAAAFLESYRERGDSLPPEIEALGTESSAVGEVLITV
jgi:predicted RNase H-like HicB family nuclease